MKIYSIEFDEYEKEALETAIKNDQNRLRSLWDRVLVAKSTIAKPHPAELGTMATQPISDEAQRDLSKPGVIEKTAPPPRAGSGP